jgi:hypothetical protein
MKRTPVRTAAAALALAALSALPPAALAGAFDTYFDRASFEAAVGEPMGVEDFGNTFRFPITTGVLNSQTDLVVQFGPPITPGLILPGVTYSTPVGESFFFNIDSAGGFDGGFLDGFYGGDPNRRLTVTFDAPTRAFGFDTNSLAPNLEVVVTFADATQQSYGVFITGSPLRFFGFVSQGGADIVSATIGGNDNGLFAFAIDNFTSPAVVPEPGSALLLLAGLAAVGAVVRRR